MLPVQCPVSSHVVTTSMTWPRSWLTPYCFHFAERSGDRLASWVQSHVPSAFRSTVVGILSSTVPGGGCIGIHGSTGAPLVMRWGHPGVVIIEALSVSPNTTHDG